MSEVTKSPGYVYEPGQEYWSKVKVFSDAECIALWRRGFSDRSIAKELGVSKTSVRNRRYKLGLEANFNPFGGEAENPELQYQKMLEKARAEAKTDLAHIRNKKYYENSKERTALRIHTYEQRHREEIRQRKKKHKHWLKKTYVLYHIQRHLAYLTCPKCGEMGSLYILGAWRQDSQTLSSIQFAINHKKWSKTAKKKVYSHICYLGTPQTLKYELPIHVDDAIRLLMRKISRRMKGEKEVVVADSLVVNDSEKEQI